MLTDSRFQNIRLPAALCLLLCFVLSCESRGSFVGTYKVDKSDSPRQIEVLLDLKANGEGLWKAGDEEVPFSWYVKGSQLRLNTKGGGVVQGIFEEGSLRMSLPNLGVMFFRRIH